MSTDAGAETIEITVDRPAGGSASVGRTADGLVVFADGALPGETVRVDLHTRRKRFARGRVVDIVNPSAHRRLAACATARAGCGGCDLAHAERDLQLEMKSTVVRDALERIARLDDIPDISIRSIHDQRYRTTVRAAVVDGRAGYRRRGSHDVVVADECLVAHPAIEALLHDGRWGATGEVVIRVSAATGDRIAILDGADTPADAELAFDAVVVPDGVELVTRSAVDAGDQPFFIEHAGGRDWQVSAGSFFQAGPAAASALVETVADAVGEEGSTGHLVDAYAGVGLFAGTVGERFDRVTAVERSASSVADARVNLRESAIIEAIPVEDWSPSPADIVVADPARTGLGQRGVDVLGRTGASRFVLISCDTGSLGRDAGLLAAAGYGVSAVEIVDAFPDTSHVETVLTLIR